MPGPPHTPDLHGRWRLVSYYDEAEDGTTTEGPLGPEPYGLLYYGPDYVSVNMARGEPAPNLVNHLGYAGSWYVAGPHTLTHAIEVCSNPAWAGTEQSRTFRLEGDVLTLRGSAVVDGRTQQRVLTWKRA
ncbi:lipocalin-like domain-containing protein [Streptomyces coeruleoprunus]|uniref:Lipocalin-like domain-containing protein n=1 Tax=Streptomyces coeruleoprunus TaxID=285563 RepID=A0ABV9XHQ6_9ACTN